MINTHKRWLDWLVMGLSLVIIAASGWWMLQSGIFSLSLAQDARLSWHLVRSAGLVAYLLLLASMVWGLFISGQFVKNWSPGPVSMTLHSTVSWLALLLGLGHGLLLLFDGYFSYTLGDIFVPFTGPYRPEAVGLGTLAFWLILIVTLSFPLKKRLGHRTWKRLHYLSYGTFVLVSLHGIFAGTDAAHLGFRLLIAAGLTAVAVLGGLRMQRGQAKVTTVAKASFPRKRQNALQ